MMTDGLKQKQPESPQKNSQQRIQQMLTNIAKFRHKSTLAQSKFFSKIKQLENKKQVQQKQILQSQKILSAQINMVEKNLIEIDKSKVYSNFNASSAKDQIETKISNFSDFCKRKKQAHNQLVKKYQDLILKTKVKLIQQEDNCKLKAKNIKYEQKLVIKQLSDNVDLLNYQKIKIADYQIRQNFKQLRASIEQEYRLNSKEQSKMQNTIIKIKSFAKDVIYRQSMQLKEGFQTNYKTLEQIFQILSTQYTS